MLLKEIERKLKGPERWEPDPENQAQQAAYINPADILLYGGSAGGGKSDLLLGVAHQQHQRSIIFRRHENELESLVERSRDILLPLGGGWRGSPDYRWRLPNGRSLEFGHVQFDKDLRKRMGRPHDFIGFDQVEHFTRAMFLFLTGWLRTAVRGQRTRVIAASNPPTDAVGMWVNDYWGAWLDPKHPNPAQPGELRWYVTDDKGQDVEVPDSNPVVIAGKMYRPLSRSFIPARLTSNSYLRGSRYEATLQALPEPLRSQMLDGDFTASQEDDAWQVIPTAWIRAAQERWTPEPPEGVPLSALGVDVARGGRDNTVITPRYDWWFGQQTRRLGIETPDGMSVIKLVLQLNPGEVPVQVDVGGVGTSPVDIGKMHKLNVIAMNGSAASHARDRSGKLGFFNKRAEWHWRFREMLDPVLGDNIALPPGRPLLADLAAPRWKMTVRGVQVESKEDIIGRIGRSPDEGDSAIYAAAIMDEWEREPLAAPMFVTRSGVAVGSANGATDPRLGGSRSAGNWDYPGLPDYSSFDNGRGW